jgi:hypothetical protein
MDQRHAGGLLGGHGCCLRSGGGVRRGSPVVKGGGETSVDLVTANLPS